MEPKFTKGKWIVSYGANSHVFEGLLHVNGEAIAFVDYESPNAHLIAAAPDMYAAATALQMARNAHHEDPTWSKADKVKAASDELDAALSRARGETK